MMSTNSSPPTQIQKMILDFIQEFTKEHGYAPTMKEIGKELGGRSVATVHQHIGALKSKGYLSKKGNSPRSLVAETEEQMTIPLLGTIAAGSPIGVFEDPTPITVSKTLAPQRDNYYALRVSGDSMVDDGIWDNDIVVVRHQNAANPGDIVVAIVKDEYGEESATLKTYYPRAEKIELRPKNQTMESIFVDPENFEIRGIFRGLIRHSNQDF